MMQWRSLRSWWAGVLIAVSLREWETRLFLMQCTLVFPTVSSVQSSHSEGEAPRTLPRGPHQLAREVVAASQRGRMIEAMAEAVAEKGYPATTVADVVSRAGVSRKT